MHPSALCMIPVTEIHCEAQVRTTISTDSMDALTESIRRRGVLVPILVRRDSDRLIMVDGHRRLAGARRCLLKTIPTIILDGDVPKAEVIQMQLVTACQREDLKPLEKAKAIESLMAAADWPASKAAESLQLSASSVSKLLSLLTLPTAIQLRVDSGDIPISAAYELAQLHDPAEQARLADEIAQGGITRDDVSRAVKLGKRNKNAGPAESTSAPSPSRVTARLGNARSITVSGPGLTFESLITWTEELLAKARKARPQGLELATFVKMLADQARA